MADLLQARADIQDLALRYCRAIDRGNLADLHQLYHHDAIDEHGAMFSGTAVDFIDWLPQALAGMKTTSHMVHNHLIVIDGNNAEGEVYCTAYHLTLDDQEVVIGGRYLDKYTYTDADGWQFLHRKIVMDWNQIQPSRCDMTSPAVAGTPVGDWAENDPSAGYFRLLR
ncbi:putative protein [BD1-7 clade bacterium]|uniref:SnoaL-like domain-containing protein n=1 Tax=BD1-7 clade bacterium TaxID=2029982 RepID=A0A5S9PCZ7_9GAMM|nr:putative protein [BD1-7 clade bacterium]